MSNQKDWVKLKPYIMKTSFLKNIKKSGTINVPPNLTSTIWDVLNKNLFYKISEERDFYRKGKRFIIAKVILRVATKLKRAKIPALVTSEVI